MLLCDRWRLCVPQAAVISGGSVGRWGPVPDPSGGCTGTADSCCPAVRLSVSDEFLLVTTLEHALRCLPLSRLCPQMVSSGRTVTRLDGGFVGGVCLYRLLNLGICSPH